MIQMIYVQPRTIALQNPRFQAVIRVVHRGLEPQKNIASLEIDPLHNLNLFDQKHRRDRCSLVFNI